MPTTIADLLIWRSFDRRGFERHAMRFGGPPLPDTLEGGRFLVTGATQGIGHALALGLASRGAHLELLCRDVGRAAVLETEVLAAGAASATVVLADLADLEAVRAAARAAPQAPLDGIVHNAGLLPLERLRSPQGFELTYAVHLLGPLILTEALLPRLREGGGRLVWMTSGGAYTQGLAPAELADGVEGKDGYDGVRSYARTKRGQIVVADALHRLLGPEVASFSVHPGWVDTRAVRESLPGFHRRMGPFLRTPDQGADGALWLLTTPLDAAARARGGLWFDREPVGQYPLPWTRPSASRVQDLLRQCVEDAGLAESELAALVGA